MIIEDCLSYETSMKITIKDSNTSDNEAFIKDLNDSIKINSNIPDNDEYIQISKDIDSFLLKNDNGNS